MKKFKLLVLLSILITGISFGSVDLDTSKIQNTTIETGKKGNTIININTPNEKGISVNDFDNFQTKDGVIFNNSGQKMNISQLEGIINGNPNITKDQAKLILNRVNGVNRTEIESTLEAVGKDKADMIFSSPNGIYLNGAKFIGFKDVTFTTAPVGLDTNGNINNLVVENGNIEIGRKGLDASKLEQISLIGSHIYIDGEIKAKTIELKASANLHEISLSSSEFGSIYGDQINIIVNGGDIALNGDIIANKDIYMIIRKNNIFDTREYANINFLEAGNNINVYSNYETTFKNIKAENDISITRGLYTVSVYHFDPEKPGSFIHWVRHGSISFDGILQANNLSFLNSFEAGTIGINSKNPISNKGIIFTNNMYFGGNLNRELGINNLGEIVANNIIGGGTIVNTNLLTITNSAENVFINNYGGKIDIYGNFINGRIENSGIFTIDGDVINSQIENSGIFTIDGNVNTTSYINHKTGNFTTKSDFILKNGYFRNDGTTIAKNINIKDGYRIENYGILNIEELIDIKSSYFENYGDMKAKNINIMNEYRFDNYGIINAQEDINIKAAYLLNAGEINTKKLSLSFKDYSSQGGKITADQITFDPYVD